MTEETGVGLRECTNENCVEGSDCEGSVDGTAENHGDDAWHHCVECGQLGWICKLWWCDTCPGLWWCQGCYDGENIDYFEDNEVWKNATNEAKKKLKDKIGHDESFCRNCWNELEKILKN